MEQLLFAPGIQVERRAYIWNLISSVVFSIQSALFLLVITRAGGPAEAGVFLILFTTAQTLNALGNYSIREFQVSDLREEYPFSSYYTTRWITCLCMAAAAAGYGIIRGVGGNGLAALAGLVAYRFIECMEDVYHGDVQRAGRFDVASVCMSLRIILSTAAFCLCYIISKSLPLSAAVLAVSSLVCYTLLIRPIRRHFPDLKPGRSFDLVPKLLKTCFPLFAGTFLYSYLINAPRYAIDALLTEDAQTIYGVLFLPVLVVNVLSTFIYRPQLVTLSRLWNEGDLSAFRKKIIGQLGLVAGLTGLIVLGGALIGLRLLEIIYGVALEAYRSPFLLLLLFGGFAASAFYLNTLLTVMRKQGWILLAYGAALVMSLLTTNALVKNRGIAGAGLAYGVIMGSLLLFDVCAVIFQIRRRARTQDPG